MYYFIYPFFVIASLGFTLLTYVLAPLVALFVKPDGNLPAWLSWFQTFDATLFEGRQPQYGFTGSNWWVSTLWLWRNPAYTFDYMPLGVAWDKTQWSSSYSVSTSGATTFWAKGPNGQFNYEYGGTLVQVKVGWKAWNLFDATTDKYRDGNWGPLPRIPFCFTIKPLL